ncbi:hypothetical protein HNP46_000363 [Pseudomonas nitritireducens]|uniref:AAA+ ATPase domain-containing protein n=1 Tax=Pseudomonas nitroreducens TaxID=46680 RepID=A0A7W7KEV7_PSENT|nr:ATP-binding protein [Pseudomonas nitritireducens]MBB4861552.1 hypothetical protein [Pseudomonas nitritireducens]
MSAAAQATIDKNLEVSRQVPEDQLPDDAILIAGQHKNLRQTIYPVIGKHPIEAVTRAENGRFRGLIFTGPPGIGKTHQIMQLAGMDHQGAKQIAAFVRLPMASRRADEFGIYLVPKEVDGEIILEQPLIEQQIIPLLEENIGDNYGILLFDDVTLGDPSLQSAILEIVQFGRIGKHKLGKNVLVAMTGNGIGHGCSAVEWNQALMTRSMLVNMRPNFKAWQKLECNKNMDARLMGFLINNQEDYWCPSIEKQPGSFDENMRGATPRDWTAIANDLPSRGGLDNYEGNVIFPERGDFFAANLGERTREALDTWFGTLDKYPTAETLMQTPEVWDDLPQSERNNKGAVYCVADMVKNYAMARWKEISALGKTAAAGEAMRKLATDFSMAIAYIMTNEQELGAYAARGMLQEVIKITGQNGDAFTAQISRYTFNGERKGEIPQKLITSGFVKLMSDVREMNELMK